MKVKNKYSNVVYKYEETFGDKVKLIGPRGEQRTIPKSMYLVDYEETNKKVTNDIDREKQAEEILRTGKLKSKTTKKLIRSTKTKDKKETKKTIVKDTAVVRQTKLDKYKTVEELAAAYHAKVDKNGYVSLADICKYLKLNSKSVRNKLKKREYKPTAKGWKWNKLKDLKGIIIVVETLID